MLRRRLMLILAGALLLLASLALACRATLFSQPTPSLLADTFFSGRAFVDQNENSQIDAGDAPLENSLFTAAGFGAHTDATGYAMVVIPGQWEQPVTAQMAPPENSGYTLIGPTEVILQLGKKTSADFLFAPQPEVFLSATTTVNPTTTGSTPQPSPTGQARPGSSELNLTYCTTTDGVELKMDIYYPKKMSQPAPVVVYVHGSGWVGGDKSDGAGFMFGPALGRGGFTFVSINYRLSPKYQFPAHIQDVQCAIRHLRANASRYNLDPQRIGAIGGSAGGHLVSLLGLANENEGWEIGSYQEPYANYSSRIQAAADLFGPADLVKMAVNARRNFSEQVFGASGADDPLLVTYSPMTYATSDDPPFLILHGLEDDAVPPEQSQILYDALISAGIPATLVMIANAGHSFQPVDGEISPSMIELQKMVLEFFQKYLM